MAQPHDEVLADGSFVQIEELQDPPGHCAGEVERFVFVARFDRVGHADAGKRDIDERECSDHLLDAVRERWMSGHTVRKLEDEACPPAGQLVAGVQRRTVAMCDGRGHGWGGGVCFGALCRMQGTMRRH